MTSQNLTKLNIEKLSDSQLKAVKLLAAGKNITHTANAVKVARETVSHWVHYDADFQDCLNSERVRLWQLFEDRMRSFVPKALDLVEDSLDRENLRTALTILQMASLQVEPIELIEAEKRKNKKPAKGYGFGF